MESMGSNDNSNLQDMRPVSTTKDLQVLRVYMRKIEGTEKDYELITEMDDSLKTLSEKSVEAINNISGEYMKFIQQIIKLDRLSKEEK